MAGRALWQKSFSDVFKGLVYSDTYECFWAKLGLTQINLSTYWAIWHQQFLVMQHMAVVFIFGLVYIKINHTVSVGSVLRLYVHTERKSGRWRDVTVEFYCIFSWWIKPVQNSNPLGVKGIHPLAYENKDEALYFFNTETSSLCFALPKTEEKLLIKWLGQVRTGKRCKGTWFFLHHVSFKKQIKELHQPWIFFSEEHLQEPRECAKSEQLAIWCSQNNPELKWSYTV